MRKFDQRTFAGNFFLNSATKISALFFFLMALSFSAFATVFNVNTTNDTHAVTPGAGTGLDASGNISIRSALEAADAVGGSHTINIPAGTYTLSTAAGFKQIVFGNTAQNITIVGAGAATTIIQYSAASAIADRDRIFFINPIGTTNSPVISVSGLTFRNAYLNSDPYGGAAICAGGGSAESLTINNCIFDNNVLPANAYGGAAVCLQVRGNLTIGNSTFTNNVSNDAGGGAVLFIVFGSALGTGYGACNITNSLFNGNSVVYPDPGASNGGAVHVTGQGGSTPFSVNIAENTFINNTADGYGGALSANNSAQATIANFKINYNRFIGNSAATDASTDAVHIAGSDGSADITNNWWGCNTGPTASPCNRGAVISPGAGSVNNFSPYIVLRTLAVPNPICNTPAGLGNTSLVTASFKTNSSNQVLAVADISQLIGLPVTWSATLGTLSGEETTIQSDGEATATFTSNGTPGTALIQARVDNIPAGDDISTADLVVNAKPVLTGPSNAVVCSGTNPTFPVTLVQGTPPITWTWFKGATPIVNGATGNGSTYAGATTATLQIMNIQVADAGTYHVEADNMCGHTVGSNFTITVELTPDLAATPVPPTTICNNGTTTINITQPNGAGGTYNRAGSYPAGVTHTAATTQNGIAYGPAFTDVLTNANATPQVVQYTFTPVGGPTLNCIGTPVVVNITVEPNPTITCPANVTVNVAPGTCAQTVNGLAPTPVCPANCGPCTITWTAPGATPASGNNDASGTSFPKGPTTVTYTITDANGNTGTCSFTVTVTDNELPILTCPANQTFSNDPGLCTAAYIIPDPISDNCPGATWSASFSGNAPNNPANFGPIADGTNGPSRNFFKGTTTVTITGVDAAGNSAVQCVFTVTVNDTEVPVLSCPGGPQTVPTDPGLCTYTALVADLISDNCPGATWSVTYSGNPNGNPAPVGPIADGTIGPARTFQKGTTTATYTGVDAAGNPAVQCSFNIVVVDNQVPVLTCPGNQTMNAGAGICTANYTIADPISDNCTGSTWSAAFSGNMNGNPANIGPIADGTGSGPITFQKGITTVTITGADADGNNAVQCTFTVTVNDNQLPVVTCPANQVLSTAPGSCDGTYTILDPVADNCTGATWSASFSGNVNGNPAPIGPFPDGTNAPPVTFFKGTTTVTLSAIDASGNAALTCTFTVTFNDLIPPTVACPANQTLNAAAGVCTAIYTIIDPVTDNCAGATWSASFAGNPNGNPVNIGPIADGTNAPVTFQKGTTTVTINAVDGSGNPAAPCTFTVTVNDTQAPTFTCPANSTQNADPGVCTFTTAVTPDPISDNCPGATWSAAYSGNPNGNPAGFGPIADGVAGPGRTFQKGTTTITYTGVDASGNPAVPCVWTITVLDNQVPVVTCPANQTIPAVAGICTADYTILDPLADNCTGATWSATFSGNANGNPANFGPIADGTNGPTRTFQKGITTVTITAVDASGNNAVQCTFTVTVTDTQVPTLVCPANQTLPTSPGLCTANYTIIDPISDNCPGATWNAAFSGNPNGNPANFGPIADGSNGPSRTFQKGTTTVTITGSDASGNPAVQCVFTVTVNDTENPILTCPANQTLSTAPNLCTQDYTILDPLFDNCAGATWSAAFSGNPLGNPANFGPIADGVNGPSRTFQKGTTTVTITGIDAVGNPAAPCTFTITVNDTQLPTLTCAPPATVPVDPGTCVFTGGIADPIADNCPGATWSVSFSGNPNGNPPNMGPIADGTGIPLVTFQKGTTTITITGIDAGGNAAVPCITSVTVVDNQLPTLICPANQVLSTAAGSCTGTYVIPDPVSDNCPGATWSASFSGNPNGNPAAIGPIPDGSNSVPIPFQKGITTVTITGVDASGNAAVPCTFTVTFNDVTPPTLTCPANVVIPTLSNQCVGNYIIFDPFSDNCPGGTWSASFAGNPNGVPANQTNIPDGTNAPSLTFQKGTTTVTITGTDASGNPGAPCTFTITVNDTQPPSITCPGNQTFYSNNPGCNYLNNNNTLDAVVTDNCPGVTKAYVLTGATTGNGSTLNGVAFNFGTTTVVWTATDAALNTATCTFSVTVNPTTGVIQVASSNPICAGGNGGIVVSLAGPQPFTGIFNIRNLTTNTSTQYTWTSNLLGGPQNINIPAANIPNTTNTPITYEFTWISLTDNGGCVGQTSGQANFTVNPLPNLSVSRSPGTAVVCPGTTINYTVITDQGPPINTVPATFNYTITRLSDNVVVQSGSNLAYGTVVPFNTPACPALGSNDNFRFSATPFAIQAPNCPGPSETNDVQIQDQGAPVFNAFPNQSFDRCQFTQINTALATNPTASGGGCAGQSATVGAPTVSFAPSCNYNNVAGYQNGETGVITRTWTATDPCGNSTPLTQTITITDGTAPTADQAAGFLNRTIEYCDINGVNGYNAANALAPTFSDGCAHPGPGLNIVKTTGVFAVGVCPTRGQFTNTWVATDPCGNVSASYTQVITVVDTQGPLFTPSSIPNQNLNAGGANCSTILPDYINTLNITANDCSSPGVFPAPASVTHAGNNAAGPNMIWQTPAPGVTVFGPGGTIIPITVTAEDGCGNQRTMTFNVQITDNIPPTCNSRNLTSTTANTPSSRIVLDPVTGQFTINFTSTNSQINAGATDNCGGSIVSSFPGGTFANPITTLTYNCNTIPNGVNTTTFTQNYLIFDQYGNSTTCSAQVRVDDLTAPVFTNGAGGANTCPPTQFVNRDAGCVAVMPSFIAPNTAGYPNVTAFDACTPVTYSQSPAAGSIIGAGAGNNVPVTITATDVHGNSNTCTFTVTFRDVTAPSFGATCPANQNNIPAGAGSCSATESWIVPTATDNCAPINNQGPITYTVTASGNNSNPNLSAPAFITPGSNVSAIFFVGTTTVTYTASDNASPANTVTCVFTVTVVDNTPPVLSACTNRSVNVNAGTCTFTQPSTSWDHTAIDNCLLATPPITYTLTGATGPVTVNTLNGQVFNRGVTNVQVIARDFSNNSSTCTFTVTVTDNIAPAFNGPNVGGCVANQTVSANTAGCIWTVPAGNTQLQVNATDNCGITLFEWDISGASPAASGSATVPFTGSATNGTWGIPSGTVFQLGVTNVQYRIRDAQGNIVTCIFTVTVQNNVTGTITGTATVAQNAATTSTITFIGSGSGAAPGTQQYRFFYSLNTNGGGFIAQPAVTTGIGSNITTVAQSNAALGTFVYRLDQVQDLATGCMSPANLNQTATITVAVITPSDLTLSWSSYQSLSFPAAGSTNNFGMNVINIGGTPSAGTITVNIPKTSAFTLTLPNVATLNGNPVNNAQWTLNTANPAFWILTTNAVVAAGGSSTAGLTITRNANVAPQTSQPMTATLVNGSGGDATPLNNSVTVQLTAQ